jgi:hypothetical protein
MSNNAPKKDQQPFTVTMYCRVDGCTNTHKVFAANADEAEIIAIDAQIREDQEAPEELEADDFEFLRKDYECSSVYAGHIKNLK